MKKGKAPTRRRRVKRLLKWIFTVLVIACLYGDYNFAPRQAVSDIADLQDMKENKVYLKCFYDGTLPVNRLGLQYLVENDDALMLCSVNWSPFGWYDRDWCKVETWDGAPVHAAIRSHSQGERSTHYLFGRMDQKYPVLTLYYLGEEGARNAQKSVVIPEEDMFCGESGDWYFVTKVEEALVREENIQVFRPRELRLCAADGEERVADIPVEVQSWST